jgi:NADH dehydrogenase [ubiquinone] 1 alpha subcomplex assembly factor 1
MNLIHLVFPLLLLFSAKPYKINFGKQEGKTNNWAILSDNVMGGLSDATVAYENNAVVIKGNVSLKNRGGFVALKSPFSKLDLSSFKTIKITFRSTKQVYAFTLENSSRWYEPAYKHAFSAKQTNTWETVTLQLNDFEEEVIDRSTGNKVNTSITKSILRIGISTNEKREGPFELEIESIELL